MKGTAERVAVNRAELDALLERAKAGPLDAADCRKLQAVVETLGLLTQLLEDKTTTIARLRQILFGASTEKTRQVLKRGSQDSSAPGVAGANTASPSPESNPEERAQDQKKGHGRNGAAAYTGATRIQVGHPSLKSGDGCPECQAGKVYATSEPGLLVRIIGQAPFGATIYELAKLRCNLCGEIFTAPVPERLGEEKYDLRSAVMIALLKYGSGFPFYRLERLQGSLGIPLPASTQWAIVKDTAHRIQPVFSRN